MKRLVLAVDVGTTNWKLGVYDQGRLLALQRHPAQAEIDPWGGESVKPQGLWQAMGELCLNLPQELRQAVGCVALTGMADEGGLLLNRATGEPETPLFPWNHPLGTGQWKKRPMKEQYALTGLPTAAKYGVYKLLALRPLTGLVWLGAPEYLAYQMTGECRTDPSLGARTGLMRLQDRQWDTERITALGLPTGILPEFRPSGAEAGTLTAAAAQAWGLPQGLPVALCGHDHLLAAYGQNALENDTAFASMGTAQVLLGTAEPPFAQAMTESGLSFGPSVEGENLTWLGSIQAAGGSLSAWRKWMGIQDDAALWDTIAQACPNPGQMLYFPFLMGRGAPNMNAALRGAFFGLSQDTEAADMLYAVLEGLCMETRAILEGCGRPFPKQLVASGGLSRQEPYLQLMADVLGCQVRRAEEPEATLFGAARLAAARCLLEDWPSVVGKGQTFAPRAGIRTKYDKLYQGGYLPLQKSLRDFAALAETQAFEEEEDR